MMGVMINRDTSGDMKVTYHYNAVYLSKIKAIPDRKWHHIHGNSLQKAVARLAGIDNPLAFTPFVTALPHTLLDHYVPNRPNKLKRRQREKVCIYRIVSSSV